MLPRHFGVLAGPITETHAKHTHMGIYVCRCAKGWVKVGFTQHSEPSKRWKTSTRFENCRRGHDPLAVPCECTSKCFKIQPMMSNKHPTELDDLLSWDDVTLMAWFPQCSLFEEQHLHHLMDPDQPWNALEQYEKCGEFYMLGNSPSMMGKLMWWLSDPKRKGVTNIDERPGGAKGVKRRLE